MQSNEYLSGANFATVEDRIAQLHYPVEIEPSEIICAECSWLLPSGRYFGKVVEYPCPTIAVLEEVANAKPVLTIGSH